MRLALAVHLILLLSGCNLFGSTPESPDVGTAPDAVSPDLAAPTDMSSSGDASERLDLEIGSVDASDGGGDEEMGGACTSNRECPLELACIDGACMERLSVGDPCEESDDCHAGLCTAEGLCGELVTPLARYRMDEASAGTAPTVLRDDAADPLDLAVSYENTSGFRVDPDGNRYAAFVGMQTGAAAAITGTKIEDAFDGGMAGTIEVKSMTFLCQNNQHRVAGIGTGGVPSEDGWFTLREIDGSDYIYVKFLPNTTTTDLRPNANGCVTAAPVVTHIVVDTTALSASDRVRMYIDGRRVPLLQDGGAALPMLNQGLDIGLPVEDRFMFVGRPNPVSGGRTTDQRVWYAAFYAEGLSEAIVQRNAAQILRNDDGPEGAGVVVRTVGINGDFRSLQDWHDARRGDLTRRYVVRTAEETGLFAVGEQLTSASGCGGRVIAENRDGTRAEFVTLDEFDSGCREGDMLTGATSGTTARFGGVMLRGTIERATITDPSVTGATLEGSITDSGHYFSITAATDMLHRGLPGTGAAVAGGGLDVGVPFTRLERLRVANSPAGAPSISIEAADVTVRHVFVEASAGDGISINADRAIVEDSLVFDSAGAGVAHKAGDGVRLRNLTIVGAGGAGVQSIGGATLHNAIADGSPAFAADDTWAEAMSNLSTDGTAPGTGSQINVPLTSLFVSLTSGSEDLRLVAGAPAIDAGSDTGVVSWDIDLRERAGAWDIGAFEQ